MQRWMYVLAGVICTVVYAACGVALYHRPSAVVTLGDDVGLVADEDVRDLGVLRQQDEQDVTFRLTNRENVPVEIVRLLTTCACSEARVAADTLLPEESTDLTTRMRAGSLRGQVVAHVQVLYKADGSDSLQYLPLLIRAQVKPHYAVKPERVGFKHSTDSEFNSVQWASIKVVPNFTPALRVLDAYSTHPAIQVYDVRANVETGTTTIYLNFDPTHSISTTSRAVVVVSTDSEMEPTHRVPVRVALKGSD